jgi:hypothetical protein
MTNNASWPLLVPERPNWRGIIPFDGEVSPDEVRRAEEDERNGRITRNWLNGADIVEATIHADKSSDELLIDEIFGR